MGFHARTPAVRIAFPILLVLLASIPAWGAAPPAPSIDVTAFGDQRLTNKSIVTTAAFSTTGGNVLLLAFVGAGDSAPGNTVTSVNGAGLTWTLVARTNAQRGTAEIWRAWATSPLKRATVTATLAQKASSSITIVGFKNADATGLNGAGAIGAIRSAAATAGAPAASLSTTRGNSWVFGVGNDWDTATARSVGGGQTLVHQFLPAGDTYWVQRTSAPLSAGGTVAVINDVAPSGDRYNLTICEILAPLPPADTTRPSVTMTAPTAATVSGTVTVGANATDDTGVIGVQFLLDGSPLGTELPGGSPSAYSTSWDTTGASNGTHALTAVARDAAGNSATATALTVEVSNPDPIAAPTKDRANAYDNAWESAWVAHARAVIAASGKTAGFVLELGDSITHSLAYAGWPRSGAGKTAEDTQIITWMRGTSWGTGNVDVNNKNGWYLAGADTTSRRGMTASGGLTTTELVLGCCNDGPTMPVDTNPPTARQIVASATYTGNLQIDTVLAAFSDAQFAVLMLGTNDPGNPNNVDDLVAIVDTLEAQHIVPILSTIPPRNDAFSDELNVQFNAAVRSLAESRSLPLIDFYREIVLRRPGTTWIGTLISGDGVHPTASGAGYTTTSSPYAAGGDPVTHTTGAALENVGYLLRSWLTVQKLKEVKRYVVDGIDPPLP
jgi:hypothetical protein